MNPWRETVILRSSSVLIQSYMKLHVLKVWIETLTGFVSNFNTLDSNSKTTQNLLIHVNITKLAKYSIFDRQQSYLFSFMD